MKSLKTIQTLSKIGKILSKIAFIFSVIGFGGCIVGLVSISFDNGSVAKWGGVTIHGILDGFDEYNIKSIAAVLFGWMIVCAGEAVLAKFAEVYFKNELKAGTPFTAAGAKEMQRLGILTIAIPIGCAVVSTIAEGIIAGFMNVKNAAFTDMYFNNGASIALGVMFIFIALICRYGAELVERKENK